MSSLNRSRPRRTTVASLFWFHHRAVVTAERREGTGRAARSDRPADVLPESDEQFVDVERVLAVEADRFDQALEIRAVRVSDGLRGIVLREQLLRRPLGHLVPRSLGQDRRDQDEERILPLRDDLREGRFPLAQVSRRKIAARQVPHDERDPLMDGRRSGQGLPPPYKWIR